MIFLTYLFFMGVSISQDNIRENTPTHQNMILRNLYNKNTSNLLSIGALIIQDNIRGNTPIYQAIGFLDFCKQNISKIKINFFPTLAIGTDLFMCKDKYINILSSYRWRKLDIAIKTKKDLIFFVSTPVGFIWDTILLRLRPNWKDGVNHLCPSWIFSISDWKIEMINKIKVKEILIYNHYETGCKIQFKKNTKVQIIKRSHSS